MSHRHRTARSRIVSVVESDVAFLERFLMGSSRGPFAEGPDGPSDTALPAVPESQTRPVSTDLDGGDEQVDALPAPAPRTSRCRPRVAKSRPARLGR